MNITPDIERKVGGDAISKFTSRELIGELHGSVVLSLLKSWSVEQIPILAGSVNRLLLPKNVLK